MNQLVHLLKQDFILLHRNKIIIISIIISTLYVLTFNALARFGNIEKILVLVIFNDPALLGFLFIGVMVLFEQNENTLQALAVTPLKISHYILSKTISLSIISLACCYSMAIACYGFNLNFIHFTFATILTSFLFSFIGFIVVAGQSSFNTYILKAIGIILLLTCPFLGYFEIIPKYWFILFPTYPSIELFSFSFSNQYSIYEIILSYSLIIIWCIISYVLATKKIIKNFIRQ